MDALVTAKFKQGRHGGGRMADFTALTGMTDTVYRNIQTARRPPLLEHVEVIAEALGVSIMDLMDTTTRSDEFRRGYNVGHRTAIGDMHDALNRISVVEEDDRLTG